VGKVDGFGQFLLFFTEFLQFQVSLLTTRPLFVHFLTLLKPKVDGYFGPKNDRFYLKISQISAHNTQNINYSN
jgi:hypothetical protein